MIPTCSQLNEKEKTFRFFYYKVLHVPSLGILFGFPSFYSLHQSHRIIFIYNINGASSWIDDQTKIFFLDLWINLQENIYFYPHSKINPFYWNTESSIHIQLNPYSWRCKPSKKKVLYWQLSSSELLKQRASQVNHGYTVRRPQIKIETLKKP